LSGVSGVYPCSQTSRLFSHEYDVDIPIKQARDLKVFLIYVFFDVAWINCSFN
jgi:hypothetical protein